MSADIALITGGAVFLTLIAFFQDDVERFDKEVFILFAQIVVVGKVENRVNRFIRKSFRIDVLEREFDGFGFAYGADAFEDQIAFVVASREFKRFFQVGEFVFAGHVDSVLFVGKRDDANERAERLDAKLFRIRFILSGGKEFFPNDGVRPIAHGAHGERFRGRVVRAERAIHLFERGVAADTAKEHKELNAVLIVHLSDDLSRVAVAEARENLLGAVAVAAVGNSERGVDEIADIIFRRKAFGGGDKSQTRGAVVFFREREKSSDFRSR